MKLVFKKKNKTACACSSLHQLNVSSGEQADVSITLSLPPALIDHLYVGDHIIWVEGDLVIRL